MRDILVAMGIGLLLFSSVSVNPRANLIRKITSQVVRVNTYKSFGGGVIIDYCYVLSVAHLIDGEIFVSGLASRAIRMTDDLVYIRVPHSFERKVKFAKKADLLEKVYIVGYPLGKKMIIPATICGIHGYTIFLNAKVVAGMSGGGVFNEKGELVGIVHGGSGTPEKLLVATSFVAIKRFLNTEE